MKNNQYYNPSIRYTEKKYINNNVGYNNMTFEAQTNYYQRTEPETYPIQTSEISKSNKNLRNITLNSNLNEGKYYPSYNKNYYYKDYYETESYQPYDTTYEDYNYQTNYNMRPFALYTQSLDVKKSNDLKKNDMMNVDEDIYVPGQTNHSYYESKYSKRTTRNPPSIISKEKLPSTNIALTKNVNKNNRFEINKSPIIKKSNENYYNKGQNQAQTQNQNLNQNQIQSQNNTKPSNISDNKNKNAILKNTSLISEIKRLNQQRSFAPRTPSVYTHHKIQSPLKRIEDETPNQILKKGSNYTKTERNLPSKSLGKIAFKKLVFSYQTNINNVSDLDNIRTSTNEKLAKIPNTPKQFKMKNLTNIYKNVNGEKKPIIKNKLINVKNRNEDSNNILKKEFSAKDHIKAQTEVQKINKGFNEKNLSKDNNENISKKNLREINISSSNIIKKISPPKNDIVKTIVNKNKTIETNEKKINKPKNYLNEKQYMKEIENIMRDNNIDSSIISKNTYNDKRHLNKLGNDSNSNSLNFININKGRIEPSTELKERKSHVLMSDIKTNLISDNLDFNKNINNRYNKTNNKLIKPANLSKSKNDYDDALFKTLKSQEIPSNKLVNNNKKSNLNKILEKKKLDELAKTEQKKISNIPKSNVQIKRLNQPEKKTNDIISSLDKLKPTSKKDNRKNKNKENETQKPRRYQYQYELPKYESRGRERSEKNLDKKEDDWGDIQYKGMRKTTYDPGRRKNKNKIKEEFHSTIYIKKSEGLSTPGKNEYGYKKTNQDTFVIEKNVNGVLNFNMFGVLDGHGDYGHFASQFVSRYIIHRIKNHPSIKKLDEPKEIYNKIIAKGYELLANIYLDADAQIQKEKFDVTRSGTTIVLVIQLEEHIICANTGDSRAIAIYDNNFEDNLMNSKIYPLSYDCKPELPNEKKRILECGGVVEKAFYSDDEDDDDDDIPYRVWAKGETYPGISMSRSIGDMDAKKVGVIPNPQIVEYTIDYFSKYVLMGSDGIWEFISNEDAMKIANKFYLRNDAIGLCHELSSKATKLWEEKDVVIDDITILVVFF